MTEARAKNVIFSDKERPRKQIKVLNLNTMMLPIMPENPNYKSGYQYERIADMFQTFF